MPLSLLNHLTNKPGVVAAEVAVATTNTRLVEAAAPVDPPTIKGKGISSAATAILVRQAKTIVPFSLSSSLHSKAMADPSNKPIPRLLPRLLSIAITTTSVLNKAVSNSRGHPVEAVEALEDALP